MSRASARVISDGRGEVCPQKKDSGSARRRNNKYEKRAAARIALTCLVGQQNCRAVRNFFSRSGDLQIAESYFAGGLGTAAP
jgi:hypothetical protein